MIEINGLTKDYGEHRGVFDLDLRVRDNEVFGFLGPNGAGKTTTIRNLLGFIHPTKGTCNINGLDCWKDASAIQTFLAYLPGEPAFIDEMKGSEFIKFIAAMNKLADLSEAERLTAYFELDPDNTIRRMSKGTKQKIALVCAFMQDSKIIILDEPSSGLDPLMQNKFIDLVLAKKREGRTIFMSSHIFEEIERCCDRTAIIREGQLVAVETLADLRRSQHKTYTIELPDPIQAKQLAAELDQAQTDGSKVTLAFSGPVDRLIKQAAKYEVIAIDVKVPTLEELFMHYYGGSTNDR